MDTILLLAHDDAGQESRLQVALDLARGLPAHLACLDVAQPPMALDFTGYGVVALMEVEREREERNRSRLEARLAHEDVAWTWRASTGTMANCLEAEAGLADLVVVSSYLADADFDLRNLAGRTAHATRRPVMAVPATTRGLDLAGPVLIAWDGSREANEALRDAVPLLVHATEVVLLTVDAPTGGFGAQTAATYLSRHGIHPLVTTATRDPGEATHTRILGEAKDIGATYIVMGAYGHSSAVELVFGGVTRSILAECPLPILIAH